MTMIEVPLSNGSVALVDDEDAWVLGNRWTCSNGYAQRRKDYRLQYMHRAIAAEMGFPAAAHVDHINGDKLDNRRANLRPADKKTNGANRVAYRKRAVVVSRFKGVCWRQDRQAWWAYITVNRKRRYLGFFHDELDAARAYNAAALEAWGEYARLNDVG